jgi:hypothetical protein
MATLVGSRHNLEVDWAGSRVRAVYSREPLGYLHVSSPW